MSCENPRLIVISGPSGSGKDTIVSRLIEKDDSFTTSVSATTRLPRACEKDGTDYYFISREEFLKKIENDEFIEYADYGSKYYGTLKSDVREKIKSGKTVILVIEITGALNIKKLYPDSLSVFIMPPSREALEERLRKRGTDSEEEIKTRLNIAKNEISESEKYDRVVVNDDLDRTVEEVYNIIKSYK